MSDPNYELPKNPVYKTDIRKLQDDDPVRAETIVNPLVEDILENIHAVKTEQDEYKVEVENKFSALETNIDWKESVATYDDIFKTYPNPDDGWTVNVKDTDYTYRWTGTEWVAISANAIPLATKDIDGKMSKEYAAKLDAIAEKANNYTHPDSGVTAGTYRSVAVNKEGHVTSGSNPTLPVSAGGTGATDAAGARSNLGTPPTNHASTAATYGSASATNYGHAMAGSTAPKAAGTAAVGTDNAKYAREDHVHPVQTTVSGNAGTATKLQTARTISLTGDASGSVTFDGSESVSGTLTLANSGATAGAYGPTAAASPAAGSSFNVPQITVDAKGRATAVANRAITLPAAQTSITGNAATASKLQTARTISLSGDASGSVSFDGSQNVSGTLTLANSGVTAGAYGPTAAASPGFGGSVNVPQVTVDAKGRTTAVANRAITLPAAPTSVSGNAGTATKLQNARTISLTGDAAGSVSFDGSANVSGPLTLADSGVTAGSYGPTAAASPAAGSSFNVPQVTVDAKGRATAVANRAITLPAAYSHPTFTAATAGETANKTLTYGGTFTVPQVGRDANGHASTLAARTMTMPAAPTSVSGNAGTATKLQNARTIALSGDATASMSFDGSANVNGTLTLANSGVTAGAYGPSAAASPGFGGSVNVPQVTVDAKGRTTAVTNRAITLPAAPTSVSGNAGTATKLQNARTISLTGDATGSVKFDGSGDVSGALTLANSGVTAGAYGPSAAASPGFGGSVNVPQITVDAKGRTTAVTNRAITLPAAQTLSSLGAAPISHASTGTTYGAASGDNYGHVKLSDSLTTTSGVTAGTAATPAAIKALNDKITELNSNLMLQSLMSNILYTLSGTKVLTATPSNYTSALLLSDVKSRLGSNKVVAFVTNGHGEANSVPIIGTRYNSTTDELYVVLSGSSKDQFRVNYVIFSLMDQN